MILNVNFGDTYTNPNNIINADFNYDITYQISGIVKYNDVVSINNIVRLYDRQTGRLIAETISDASGLYVFDNLGDNNLKYVICLDKSNPISYNALIIDRLIPT